MSSSDKIVYGFSNQNTGASNKLCVINDNLDRRIIPSQMSDYQASIVFMSIPTFDIPIFFFEEYTDALTIDYWDTATGTRISRGQTFLKLVARDRLNSNRIYQISQFIEILNNGIYDAYLDCDDYYFLNTGLHLPNYVAGPPITFTGVPIVYYDKITQRITIKAPTATFQDLYDIHNVGDNGVACKGGQFNMYFNVTLFEKLTGIDNYSTGIHSDTTELTPYHPGTTAYIEDQPTYPGDTAFLGLPPPLVVFSNPKCWGSPTKPFMNYGQDFRVIFHDDGTNISGGIISNIQQWTSFFTLHDFVSIQVTTSLPIQQQYSSLGNANVILAEIQPTDLTLNNFNQALVYNPIYPYNWKDIVSPIQINDVTFKVYYTISKGVITDESLLTNVKTYGEYLTKTTNLIQLRYPPDQNVTIRLMFQKKQTSNY